MFLNNYLLRQRFVAKFEELKAMEKWRLSITVKV